MTNRRCHPPPAVAAALLFARHGATAPNLAGVRCGGDLDAPLTDAGRQQARSLGLRIAARQRAPELIVTSALSRTRETAALIAAAIGGPEVVIEPLFCERRLGAWNLKPVAMTQSWLDAGLSPPGGESSREFADRISEALRRILPLLDRRVLLVGSRGVARVLGELSGTRTAGPAANAELIEFPTRRLFNLFGLATAGGTP